MPTKFWQIVQALGTWFGALATAGTLFGGALYVADAILTASNKAGLAIMTPKDGGEVRQRAVMTGHSTLSKWKHYVVIIDVPLGGVYVQAGPIPVGANGMWNLPVTFGDPGRNCGVQFVVMFFGTMQPQPLPPGQRNSLADLPPDAAFSPSVTVERAGDC